MMSLDVLGNCVLKNDKKSYNTVPTIDNLQQQLKKPSFKANFTYSSIMTVF